MSDSQTRQVSTTLYEEDIALVEQVSRDKNLRNFSAALRLIIGEYRKAHGEHELLTTREETTQ